MQAVKENKVYTITETEQQSYQDQGFDIYNDDGEVVAYGRGKTVSYEEYEKLLKENETLKAAAKLETVLEATETEEDPKKDTGKKK